MLGLGALGAALLGYRSVRADLRAEVYRDRLEQMVGQYESLRTVYNAAVRRTAVTELLVRDGRLWAQVRTAEGVTRRIETPFDPNGEIFVDYLVLDGRLWIRRVFDAGTPPQEGLVIDPEADAVDWSGTGEVYGKAVYRRLGDGRWVVTVTGDGSLGLARADAPADLSPAPGVRDYEQVIADAGTDPGRIGPGDVWRWLTGGR